MYIHCEYILATITNMNYRLFNHFRNYKYSSKLVNPVSGILNKVQYFETPQRLKGTFLERWGMYWKNLYIDYKQAALDTTKDCKEHPIRTSIYATLLVSYVYLNKHNPDECSFKENVLQNTLKVMQVGEVVRNPISEGHVKWLGQCYNEGIVRHMNLGIISLIWLDDYDKTCSLYKAICPYLKVQYLTFYERIIDFGFLDRWWILESKMKDYDVNDGEFKNVKCE